MSWYLFEARPTEKISFFHPTREKLGTNSIKSMHLPNKNCAYFIHNDISPQVFIVPDFFLSFIIEPLFNINN